MSLNAIAGVLIRQQHRNRKPKYNPSPFCRPWLKLKPRPRLGVRAELESVTESDIGYFSPTQRLLRTPNPSSSWCASGSKSGYSLGPGLHMDGLDLGLRFRFCYKINTGERVQRHCNVRLQQCKMHCHPVLVSGLLYKVTKKPFLNGNNESANYIRSRIYLTALFGQDMAYP